LCVGENEFLFDGKCDTGNNGETKSGCEERSACAPEEFVGFYCSSPDC
jgi:hypothetical protein